MDDRSRKVRKMPDSDAGQRRRSLAGNSSRLVDHRARHDRRLRTEVI